MAETEAPREFRIEGRKSKFISAIGTSVFYGLGLFIFGNYFYSKYINHISPLYIDGYMICTLAMFAFGSLFLGSHLYERNRKVLLYEDRIVFAKDPDKVLLEVPFGSIVKLKVLHGSDASKARYEITTKEGKVPGFGVYTENAEELAANIESKTGMKF